MIIIGISGKKGQGKDTVAQILLNKLPLNSCIKSFAGELKNEVHAALNVPHTNFNFEGFKPQLRLIYQGWGTFKRTCVDPKYWIKKLNHSLIDLNPDIVIISDVRFLNEKQWIESQGGLIIRVSGRPHDKDNHISETELDNTEFNITINNNYTLEALKELVDNVYNDCILPNINNKISF